MTNNILINIKNIASRRSVLVTVFLLVLCNVSVLFSAERYYLSVANGLIDQANTVSWQRANDLTDSIRRNLTFLHGIPELLSELLRVKAVASRFGPDVTVSSLSLESRRKLWTTDAQLNDLSRYLMLAKDHLDVDLIFILNAAGDCIAASNWDAGSSPIGSNYAEHEFFKKNQNGQAAMQYAVGKTSHIAGLYFSTPLIIAGKFMGAVVTKAEVGNLSYLIKQFDAFVADSNGVIIMAHEKSMEMTALPEAAIAKLSEQDRFSRYRRSDFPLLKIESWQDQRFPSLTLFDGETVPQTLWAKDLPEYGLQIFVEQKIPEIILLKQAHFRVALLLQALASLLILAATGLVLYLHTIKQSKEMLWRRVNFDTLTDLPNRDLLHDRLSQEFKKADRSSLPIALLLIDLDQFKEVNDTLGHEMGDVLLQEAARRIVSCVRASDTVARLGGDEFAVVLPQLHDVTYARSIAQKIISKLAEPFNLRGEIAYVTASLGITVYPADALDIDGMLRNVDQAMYVAKNEGRNRYRYYTVELQEKAQNKLHLTHDLRNALPENQLVLYFQPIVELKTNQVHKAEALLRWQHPTRGQVSPAEFIPLAEETRLILEIGVWICKEAMRWGQRWNGLAAAGFQISINKSPVEFMDESGRDSVASFVAQLHELGLSGDNFVFEITEGLLLNADERISNKLMVLRDAGIQVSIDDFGTGYSSLSYLKKFDIDYLKIDQSFVRNLSADSDDLALCEAIIVMAHKLGLKVIAEGVETVLQRDLLSGAGCDYAQGYLYSRPIPPEEFEAWMNARGW